ALGAEDDAAAVRTPDDASFRSARRREAAGEIARAGVDQPQVAELAVLVVGGFGHLYHDPAAVGAHLRRADALHEPDVFVSRNLPGGGGHTGDVDPGKQKYGEGCAQARNSADAVHGAHGIAITPVC